MKFLLLTIASLLLASPGIFAQGKLSAPDLIAMAKNSPQSPAFRESLVNTLGAKAISEGTAALGEGTDFIWAVRNARHPQLLIDDNIGPKMLRLEGTDIWYATGTMDTGRSHAFAYKVNGSVFGGKNDIPVFGPDSYTHAGVPQGKLSEKLTHVSKIYDGMTTEYWIYVPAQYNAATPAALMVWQDGAGHTQRDAGSRTLNVLDNLTHQGKIPVMISVMINPGTKGNQRLRSVQYDSVNDVYARFLRDELLPEVYKKYNIRKDGYSRAITGSSSGGICAFNAAWFQNDQWTRVWTRVGSFTSIQWKPGVLDGGNVYPNMVRKQAKHNIRIWMSDGSEDLENDHGSWPLQNIQLANSLKMKEYDFHLNFGGGSHNGAMGNSEMPDALKWIWRGYDPKKTEETFQMEESEKLKPYFRVKIYNR